MVESRVSAVVATEVARRRCTTIRAAWLAGAMVATASVQMAFGASNSVGAPARPDFGHDGATVSSVTVTDDSSRRVLLTFDSPLVGTGRRLFTVENLGSAPTVNVVLELDGGVATTTTSFSGIGMRLPARGSSSEEPRAVLRVTNASEDDLLNPGSDSFRFGADFRLQATSDGTVDDAGDNLVQRGLYESRSQYKLQMDHGRPSCVIKGSEGRVSVFAPVVADAGAWYRVECSRTASLVTLTLTDLDTGAALTWSESGETGDLTPGTSVLPLSVGGKVYRWGEMVPETDQFNGKIDNVLLEIG